MGQVGSGTPVRRIVGANRRCHSEPFDSLRSLRVNAIEVAIVGDPESSALGTPRQKQLGRR